LSEVIVHPQIPNENQFLIPLNNESR